MRLMWLWIGSTLPVVVIADKLCLPEGIAEDTRVYVNHFSESAGTPIRFLVYDWPSAKAATSIANILIRETLGIHSVMNETIDTVLEATLKLSGCEDVDCKTEDKRLVRHAALETWSSAANELLSFQAAHPEKAPVDLGSIGYQSEEHLFISAATVSKAYEETGNSLAYYRGYNRSHHSKAHQYFAQLVDLPEDEFVPCNESKWVNPAFINPYVKYTGDLDGVIEVTDGNFHARCHKNFWIAPSCRHNVSECIPIVTSGYGWFLDTIMMWSSSYGLPTALGITRNFDLYVSRISSTNTIFYWWRPDVTFLHLDPEQVIFPRHDADAWAKGDKRTASEGSHIGKLVNINLDYEKKTQVRQVTLKLG